MIDYISHSKPNIIAATTVASGTTGATLWMQEATGILAFWTAIGAFLTMICGLIYWIIKVVRFAKK